MKDFAFYVEAVIPGIHSLGQIYIGLWDRALTKRYKGIMMKVIIE